MLELKPNCELCDKDLPPESEDACICSYECTFCRSCVDTVLENVCPNCGGGFTPRPIRPSKMIREGTSLIHHPASKKRVHAKYTMQEIKDFVSATKNILPKDR